MYTSASRLSASAWPACSCRRALPASRSQLSSAAKLLFLVVLEPFDAAFQHAGHERDVVLLGDLQAVDDDRPSCAACDCSPQPLNQPQPPSESCISVSRLTPALTIFVSSASSNTGLRSNRFQPLGPLGVVADFLGVEIGALLLDRLQVEAHLAAAFAA